MPYVYIVRCADDTLYTGWALDVAQRVRAHNCGRGARYTRAHGPVVLVYSEELPTRADAMRRELAIKRYPRAKKLALCNARPRAAVQSTPEGCVLEFWPRRILTLSQPAKAGFVPLLPRF